MSTAQRTRTDFLCLTISAGSGVEEQQQDRPGENYRYTVSVQSDATGVTRRFTFHDSVDRHRRGIDQLDREGLLEAFWSFVQDAEAGACAFDEFCAEFGYDTDSRKARAEWRACKNARRTFDSLWHDGRQPGEVLRLLELEGVG